MPCHDMTRRAEVKREPSPREKSSVVQKSGSVDCPQVLVVVVRRPAAREVRDGAAGKYVREEGGKGERESEG